MTTVQSLSKAPGYRDSFRSFTSDGPSYQERCGAPQLVEVDLPRPQGRLALPITSRGSPYGEVRGESQIVAQVLEILNKHNVDYCDLRLGREINRSVNLLDTNLTSHQYRETEGIGIRVYHQGAWGFASTVDPSPCQYAVA